ncbi:DUF1310 family protein [Streptococcus sanguinis]|jgi:hypothetical protein|uniref:DUF1310 family protein n=2 Tax=Streptococcus sanguinis TaxID=1305 RepID=UPI001CBF971D|nr:DUF1310 family protein [Streptococcus sanguinis]MBZ2073722.1 DUF1310 domain-containing protein [Streptococcus sanguinis]MBZ2081645.1 DUF1310 domain-containing protein [Streptococcus sanguinis]MCC3165722.1 hypothetical protein [Streptococcus sanguinis]
MKQKHKIILSVVSLFLALCLGGVIYLTHKNQEFHNEMTRIAHSEEVKKLIVEELKAIDPNALTEKGKIRSYKIDDSSIKHNPMGGIMFHVIINDDSDAAFKFGIRKYGEDGRMSLVGGTLTEKLQKLLEE